MCSSSFTLVLVLRVRVRMPLVCGLNKGLNGDVRPARVCFSRFFLKQGIDFIVFCLNQGIDFINFCLNLDCLQSAFSLKILGLTHSFLATSGLAARVLGFRLQ